MTSAPLDQDSLPYELRYVSLKFFGRGQIQQMAASGDDDQARAGDAPREQLRFLALEKILLPAGHSAAPSVDAPVLI